MRSLGVGIRLAVGGGELDEPQRQTTPAREGGDREMTTKKELLQENEDLRDALAQMREEIDKILGDEEEEEPEAEEED